MGWVKAVLLTSVLCGETRQNRCAGERDARNLPHEGANVVQTWSNFVSGGAPVALAQELV